MPQPKGAIPWNKGRHGLQVAWSKGKKLPYLSGKKSFSWKGGRHIRTDGYVGIYSPNHPRAKSAQYILEHILIMEKKIGRYISKNEIVHHINGIKNDNRIENLEVMTRAEHLIHHNPHNWKSIADLKQGLIEVKVEVLYELQ